MRATRLLTMARKLAKFGELKLEVDIVQVVDDSVSKGGWFRCYTRAAGIVDEQGQLLLVLGQLNMHLLHLSS